MYSFLFLAFAISTHLFPTFALAGGTSSNPTHDENSSTATSSHTTPSLPTIPEKYRWFFDGFEQWAKEAKSADREKEVSELKQKLSKAWQKMNERRDYLERLNPEIDKIVREIEMLREKREQILFSHPLTPEMKEQASHLRTKYIELDKVRGNLITELCDQDQIYVQLRVQARDLGDKYRSLSEQQDGLKGNALTAYIDLNYKNLKDKINSKDWGEILYVWQQGYDKVFSTKYLEPNGLPDFGQIRRLFTRSVQDKWAEFEKNESRFASDEQVSQALIEHVSIILQGFKSMNTPKRACPSETTEIPSLILCGETEYLDPNTRDCQRMKFTKSGIRNEKDQLLAGGHCDETGYISNIWVPEEYRNQGLAQKLMNYFIKECPTWYDPRPKKLHLWVFSGNLPALKAYLSVGFRVEKTEDIRFIMKYPLPQ